MASANRLGFWSSVMTVVVSAVFFGAGIFTPARGGTFCVSSCITYPYTNGLAPLIPGDYIWQIPAFLLAPIFVVLVACVHRQAPPMKKAFSQAGMSFATVYAAVISADYFVQWTVVVPSILKGQTGDLSLLTQYNPDGLFIALECLGYLMMSAAFVSIAVVFAGRGRLERTIRWALLAGFVASAGSFLAVSLAGDDIVVFEVVAITIVTTVLMVSGTMLAIFFRRAERIEGELVLAVEPARV